jgi:hypothetical protein
LPGLASNCNPPDLCLLSSWDYRSEPQAPGPSLTLNERPQPSKHETYKLLSHHTTSPSLFTPSLLDDCFTPPPPLHSQLTTSSDFAKKIEARSTEVAPPPTCICARPSAFPPTTHRTAPARVAGSPFPCARCQPHLPWRAPRQRTPPGTSTTQASLPLVLSPSTCKMTVFFPL